MAPPCRRFLSRISPQRDFAVCRLWVLRLSLFPSLSFLCLSQSLAIAHSRQRSEKFVRVLKQRGTAIRCLLMLLQPLCRYLPKVGIPGIWAGARDISERYTRPDGVSVQGSKYHHTYRRPASSPAHHAPRYSVRYTTPKPNGANSN